jgi:heme-degrading monooxygenase HmoA
MFVSIGIHYPRPGKEKELIDSMGRFGAAMKGKPGFRQAFSLQDRDSGALVGLAIWDSREQWEAAHPAMLEAIKEDPFDEWEDTPPEVFHLDEVFHIGEDS